MKEKELSHFNVVSETIVNTPKSMLTMSAGETVSIPCTSFAPLSTVRSAASRLNQQAGWTEFEVSTPDNGATIVFRRNAKHPKIKP